MIRTLALAAAAVAIGSVGWIAASVVFTAWLAHKVRPKH